jgi:hypothetical protein
MHAQAVQDLELNYRAVDTTGRGPMTPQPPTTLTRLFSTNAKRVDPA